MKEFVLLFRMNLSAEARPSKDRMNTYMQQWMEWISEMAQNDRLADGGNHFSPTGRVLKSNHEMIETLYVADDVSVAGYIIVLAADMDEATKMAGKSPLLNGHDTSVEIRATAMPGESSG